MRFAFSTLDSLLTHDRTQLRTVVGLRNAIGVVLPLIVGLMVGNVLAGLAVAIGAQVSGFAGLNGTARKRVRTMAFGGIWMGITTLVGGLAGHGPLSIVVLTVLGFVAGLLVCLSLEAGLIGMWSIIALLFTSGLAESPIQALEHALLIIVGALIQLLLLMLVDWLSQSNPERAGVSASFRAIAQYGRDASRDADLRVASSLLEADARLRDSFLERARWLGLRALLDLAESLRIEVVALTGILRTVQNGGLDDTSGTDVRDLDLARTQISEALAVVADRLDLHSRFQLRWWRAGARRLSPASLSTLLDELERAAERLEAAGRRHASQCVRHACAELTRVADLVTRDGRGVVQRLTEQRLRFTVPAVKSAIETMRTHLTFHSVTFRHAVRLALTLCVAVLLSRVSPLARGYWLPLTVVVILKPEFVTTFSRGVGRSIGTLLGALVATLLISIPDQTHTLVIVLLGLLLWGMYMFLNYNLVLFSCFLTAEVVVLLSFFERLPPLMTIADRVVYTVAGSVLAFLAYIVWPTWQHQSLPDALGKLVLQEKQYLKAVLGGGKADGADDPLQKRDGAVRSTGLRDEVISSSRKMTRLARTNAVALVNQVLQEPVNGKWGNESVRGMLTASHRFSEAILWVESYLVSAPQSIQSNADVRQFVDYLDRSLTELADMVQEKETADTSTAVSSDGVLDSIRTFTKQQIREMNIPGDLVPIFIRMEDAMGTMFRMASGRAV